MPPKKKKQDWLHSDARAALYAAIMAGQIPLHVPQGETETTDQLFQHFNVRSEVVEYGEFEQHFKRRLKALRENILTTRSRADEDKEAFDVFVKNHPKSDIAANGLYPEWEGSDAQKQLREDMKNNKHNTMAPQELHDSNEAYDLFPLKVFRDHIYQEMRTEKCLKQVREQGKGGNKWKEFRDYDYSNNNNNSGNAND